MAGLIGQQWHMMRAVAKCVACCLLLAATGCREWMEDEGPAVAPSGVCICARACGAPIVNGTHWVDVAGVRHGLGGQCPKVSDAVIARERPRCQCDYFQSVPPLGGRPSPNH